MKLVRYVCTHCGRKFEAEEKDVLECPGCFWSTSVKREDDAVSSSSFKGPSASPKSSTGKPLNIPPAVRLVFVFVIGMLFLFLTFPLFKKILPAPRPKVVEIETASKPEKPKNKKQQPAKSTVSTPAAPAAQNDEDKNILSRRLDVSADRQPTEAEQQILKARAPFSSGSVEKLPSQAWTLEDYEKMIAGQEKFYRVPLPGSYKKKLTTLFKTKYLAAAENFKEGKLLEARDLWVESLAFPIYADNVQKHRGVVLTMLRGFINDTLSKVGAINISLVEGKIRAQERLVTENYSKLSSALDKQDWKEAYGLAVDLQRQIEQLATPDPSREGGAEPYPNAALGAIDDGIRTGLFEVLNVPPPSVADLEPMQRDLLLKRKVIESFLPENLEPVKTRYQEALDLISQSKWAEAEAKLKEISYPVALYEDARDKIKVLRKLQGIDGSAEPAE